MGRPLRKDVYGTDVIGTPASATGITCEFYDGSTNRTDGVIIKQRGASSFVVCRIGQISTPANYKVCKLVDTTPNADGEMRIQGSTTGLLDQGLVPIAKLTRRIAYGFPSSPDLSNGFWRGEDSNDANNHDQTKYNWYLENDSSADYIVLTPITATM
jgi:hypothetical protein